VNKLFAQNLYLNKHFTSAFCRHTVMDLEENENTEKEMRNQIINYAEENRHAFYEKKTAKL
jgi:hypothetical protein